MGSSQVYIHSIDKSDKIISVSDNWGRFAIENDAYDTCMPEQIVGSSLWDHIADGETRHLYEIILRKVRERQVAVSLPFRCDAPNIRRYLRLSVMPGDDDVVIFKSEVLRTEVRAPVEFLQPEIARSDELIRVCSLCWKIALSDEKWVEIEEAVDKLNLFDKPVLPKPSHGICPSCYKSVLEEIEKL